MQSCAPSMSSHGLGTEGAFHEICADRVPSRWKWGGAAAGYNPSFTNGPAAVSMPGYPITKGAHDNPRRWSAGDALTARRPVCHLKFFHHASLHVTGCGPSSVAERHLSKVEAMVRFHWLAPKFQAACFGLSTGAARLTDRACGAAGTWLWHGRELWPAC